MQDNSGSSSIQFNFFTFAVLNVQCQAGTAKTQISSAKTVSGKRTVSTLLNDDDLTLEGNSSKTDCSGKHIYLNRGVIFGINGLQHFHHAHPFQHLSEDHMLAV